MGQRIVVVERGWRLRRRSRSCARRGSRSAGGVRRRAHLPYERPPLSKGFLLGNDELETVFVHDPDWYDEHDVDLRLGTGVDRDRPRAARRRTRDGEQSYDRLLLATASSPRRLAMADDSGAPVAYLRTIEDSQRLKAAFGEGRRWSSSAAAGSAWRSRPRPALAGSTVTVLESRSCRCCGCSGPRWPQVFADLHREHGVDLRTGVQVTAVERTARGPWSGSADGRRSTADLVLVGIGVAPNTAPRRGGRAGRRQRHPRRRAPARPRDPDVYAAGDVANADHPVLGRRMRVEHWDNAIEQGKAAARNMLGAGRDATTGCRTSSPTSTTSAWSTSAASAPTATTRSCSAATRRGRSFTAFWLAAAGSSPACTSTTGTPSTTYAGSSARVDAAGSPTRPCRSPSCRRLAGPGRRVGAGLSTRGTSAPAHRASEEQDA